MVELRVSPGLKDSSSDISPDIGLWSVGRSVGPWFSASDIYLLVPVMLLEPTEDR